jgi:Uma2 family endonuclease
MIGMGTKTALTPADLLAMPDDDTVDYELSDGELITIGKAGMWHELIKSNVLKGLFAYEIQHPEAGRVFSESLFQLGPATARIPDVAFVSAAKVALSSQANIVIPVVPDLAIEVISESETAASAEAKVEDYLAAGVLEVWQIYPRGRRVRVHTSDRVYDLTGDQVLETPVLPGFSVKASPFFE